MAVIQYSINSETYVNLVERGRKLGLSEHQVAKYIMLAASDITDDQVLTLAQATKRASMERKTRARPLS